MKLAIRHATAYRYDPPVAAAEMRVKLFPSVHAGQRVLEWSVRAGDAPLTPAFRNGWGDDETTLSLRGGVEALEIVAEGVVETEDRAGLLTGFKAAIRPGVCLRETRHTRADDALRALAAEAESAADAPLGRAHALNEMVADRVRYTPGATEFHGTAAEALAAGAGVCQDQTHVMIAACRALGWPARYVAGYYLSSAEGGEHQTHAWMETFLPDIGWVGFDPTHRLCPTDHYVRLCSGLDAVDAAPLRGHVEGAAEETLSVSVAMTPVAQSQTQSQTRQ
jgi:transglutaminase-like putative cysteine protease